MKFRKNHKTLFLFLFIFLLANQIFSFFYRPQVSDYILTYVAKQRMQKIAVALLAYSEAKEGSFPSNLEELVTLGYLPDPDNLVCPVTHAPIGYHYISGLHRDMPSIVPILIEKNANHHYQNQKYFGVVDLGFSSNIQYLTENRLSSLLHTSKKNQEIILETNGSKVFSTLQGTYNPIIQNICIWRLGQLAYQPAYPFIARYLSSPSKNTSSSAVMTAAFALSLEERQKALPWIAQKLSNENYLLRKKSWQVIQKEVTSDFFAPNLVPFSQQISRQHYEKWLKSSP